jgi:hypothetical protein
MEDTNRYFALIIQYGRNRKNEPMFSAHLWEMTGLAAQICVRYRLAFDADL